MNVQSPRGFRDILPPESALFAGVEAAARSIFALLGADEIRDSSCTLKFLKEKREQLVIPMPRLRQELRPCSPFP